MGTLCTPPMVHQQARVLRAPSGVWLQSALHIAVRGTSSARQSVSPVLPTLAGHKREASPACWSQLPSLLPRGRHLGLPSCTEWPWGEGQLPPVHGAYLLCPASIREYVCMGSGSDTEGPTEAASLCDVQHRLETHPARCLHWARVP